jgi:hypothetical protein
MILVKNLNDLHSLIYGNNYSDFGIFRDNFNRINYTYHVYGNDFLNNKQYKIDEKYTDGEEKAYFFKDGTVGFFVKIKQINLSGVWYPDVDSFLFDYNKYH